MSTGFTLIILAEVALLLFIVWGYCHEDIFVAFEDRIIAAVKHNIKVRVARRAAQKRRKASAGVSYRPVKPTGRGSSSAKAA